MKRATIAPWDLRTCSAFEVLESRRLLSALTTITAAQPPASAASTVAAQVPAPAPAASSAKSTTKGTLFSQTPIAPEGDAQQIQSGDGGESDAEDTSSTTAQPQAPSASPSEDNAPAASDQQTSPTTSSSDSASSTPTSVAHRTVRVAQAAEISASQANAPAGGSVDVPTALGTPEASSDAVNSAATSLAIRTEAAGALTNAIIAVAAPTTTAERTVSRVLSSVPSADTSVISAAARAAHERLAELFCNAPPIVLSALRAVEDLPHAAQVVTSVAATLLAHSPADLATKPAAHILGPALLDFPHLGEPIALLTDSLAAFANESSFVGVGTATTAPVRHAGAITVSAAVLAFDAYLLARYRAKSRRQPSDAWRELQ